MDTLALRGVPLPVAPGFTADDTALPAYAAAQRAFDAARGEGTPLLPEAGETADRGPAGYVRETLIAMLVRHAAGEDPRPMGDAELRAAAEAHMALVESVASEASSLRSDVARPPRVATAPASRVRFGVIEHPRADWLAESILKSIVRRESVKPLRSTAPSSDAPNDPLLRLAQESAYWRGVPPHGKIEKDLAEQRSTLTGNVKDAPRLYVEAERISVDLEEPVDPRTGRWLQDAASQLAGLLNTPLDADQQPPVLRADSVKAAVLRKMAEEGRTPSGNRAMVVSADTVNAFLSNFDVMRDYVFQPV